MYDISLIQLPTLIEGSMLTTTLIIVYTTFLLYLYKMSLLSLYHFVL